MSIRSMEDLQHRLTEFVAARDWEQFHTPKNLAMALSGEVGELVAEFQWMTATDTGACGATPPPEMAPPDVPT